MAEAPPTGARPPAAETQQDESAKVPRAPGPGDRAAPPALPKVAAGDGHGARGAPEAGAAGAGGAAGGTDKEVDKLSKLFELPEVELRDRLSAAQLWRQTGCAIDVGASRAALGLELRPSDGDSVLRGVVATRRFEPGELVIREWPFAVSGMMSRGAGLCRVCCCVDDPSSDLACPVCRMQFCSKACEERYAGLHELECGCIQRILTSEKFNMGALEGVTDVAILVMRMLLRRALDIKEGRGTAAFDALMALESHIDWIKEEKSELWDGIDRGTHFLLDILPSWVVADWAGSQAEDIVQQLWCIVNINSFEVGRAPHPEPSNDPLPESGTAIFLATSFVNHSCTPNAVYHVENGCISLHAVQEIDVGDELTVSYLESSYADTASRRAELLSEKAFWCCCEMCRDPRELDGMRAAIRCATSCCPEDAWIVPNPAAFRHDQGTYDESQDSERWLCAEHGDKRRGGGSGDMEDVHPEAADLHPALDRVRRLKEEFESLGSLDLSLSDMRARLRGLTSRLDGVVHDRNAVKINVAVQLGFNCLMPPELDPRRGVEAGNCVTAALKGVPPCIVSCQALSCVRRNHQNFALLYCLKTKKAETVMQHLQICFSIALSEITLIEMQFGRDSLRAREYREYVLNDSTGALAALIRVRDRFPEYAASVPPVEEVFACEFARRCSFCWKKSDRDDGTSLASCSRCHSVRYCSLECQRSDWPVHRGSCRGRAATWTEPDDGDTDDARLLRARLISERCAAFTLTPDAKRRTSNYFKLVSFEAMKW